MKKYLKSLKFFKHNITLFLIKKLYGLFQKNSLTVISVNIIIRNRYLMFINKNTFWLEDCQV